MVGRKAVKGNKGWSKTKTGQMKTQRRGKSERNNPVNVNSHACGNVRNKKT
jgi:hypothetical protein